MMSMYGKDGRRCVCCLCHEGSNGPSVCLANQLGDLPPHPGEDKSIDMALTVRRSFLSTTCMQRLFELLLIPFVCAGSD